VRQTLIEADAEGEDVGAAVDRRALDLFGSHVVRRSEELSGGGEIAAAGDLGDPEIHDLRPRAVEQDDVGRFHVPMDDSLRMSEVERLCNLRDDVGGLLEGERPSLRQDFLEVLSLDVLHGDEGDAGGIVHADVEDGDDGRMVEDAGGLSLADEALLEFVGLVFVALSRPDRLQGDEAADQRIFGEVDDAHRPLAQLANDLITPELHQRAISAGTLFRPAAVRVGVNRSSISWQSYSPESGPSR
jgi:hypothetical protein